MPGKGTCMGLVDEKCHKFIHELEAFPVQQLNMHAKLRAIYHMAHHGDANLV